MKAEALDIEVVVCVAGKWSLEVRVLGWSKLIIGF